ncbi:RNA polymerase sigma factor [Spirosoma flavus]
MNVRLTDEEMIRRYLPSQPSHCFETLYNRYANKVYRRCLSMTKNSEQAQDFTHDIFLKVFNKLDDFQERSSFSTWLYSISFNYCSDQIRLAKRLSVTALDDTLNQDFPESRESAIHEETMLLVKRAMETISPKERTLLQLKYEEGMSIDAIAEKYNLKSSTVKMRLKRTRDKLQRLYSYRYASDLLD